MTVFCVRCFRVPVRRYLKNVKKTQKIAAGGAGHVWAGTYGGDAVALKQLFSSMIAEDLAEVFHVRRAVLTSSHCLARLWSCLCVTHCLRRTRSRACWLNWITLVCCGTMACMKTGMACTSSRSCAKGVWRLHAVVVQLLCKCGGLTRWDMFAQILGRRVV